MHKLFHTLAIAALALALPLAASAQNNLNLDTGAAVSSGGDIAFSGAGIAPVGSAMLADLTTEVGSEFSLLVSSGFLEQLLADSNFSTAPIPSSSLVDSEVIAVQTNGGNYAAVMVTAASSGSITLQYVTYNTSGTKIQGLTSVTLGGPAAPQINQVQNNYSFILPGAPNYGIAPGALVLISGSAMAAPGTTVTSLSDPSKALPQTLNGAQVTVTVGGTTVHPGLYYVIPNYIGAVLPSNLPTGSGTMTVSYGGQTSAAFPITLVGHAFGFDYYGGGLATVTDNSTGALITTTNSARPGETVVFWGAGDGADTNNTDLSPPTHYDNLSGITALYFGSVQVPIVYQGRSPYQGVDQIDVTIPANVPTGCAVSVVGVSGGGANAIASNIAAMPIATNGGACTDPLTLVDPGTASTLSGKTTVKFGGLSVDQLTDYQSGSAPTENQEAGGFFYSISGSSLTGYNSRSQPSEGSCFVTQSNASTVVDPFTITGLNAGNLTVTGPDGQHTLQTIPEEAGLYFYAPTGTGFIPPSGGTYTFAGSGGTDVGAFSNASVAFFNPLTWTNATSIGTINRSSGVTVNWTGGAQGTYAEISGSSAVLLADIFSASFICTAPVSAGTFTVPPAVLLQLPAGSGSLSVSNYTYPKTLNIPNLDFSYIMAYAGTDTDATYQ